MYVFAGLHHLPKLDLALRGSYKVMRPKGTFTCFEPNSKCFYRFLMLKLRKILNLYTEDEIFLDPDEVAGKLRNAGFSNIRITYLTPSYKFSHITWMYPFFLVMKLVALLPGKYFQSFFIITAKKGK